MGPLDLFIIVQLIRKWLSETLLFSSSLFQTFFLFLMLIWDPEIKEISW